MSTISLIGPYQPRDPVGTWLKECAASDVVHLIVWKHGNELRTDCQKRMSTLLAVRARSGARMCEVCFAGWRSRNRKAKRR